MNFAATKKGMTTNFFHPSLLLLFLDPRSEVRCLGSGMGKNQDPGSGINIPDSQHCFFIKLTASIYAHLDLILYVFLQMNILEAWRRWGWSDWRRGLASSQRGWREPNKPRKGSQMRPRGSGSAFIWAAGSGSALKMRIPIRIGSEFIWAAGSGSAFKMRIQIGIYVY